jgi:hypothetical protein|tara:strand:+ start:3311 stop:3565 length:255 start_codon:yes stop_codon:yes gene_type:complete
MTEKESVFELTEDQKDLYSKIYKLIDPHIKPNNPNSLLMTSGTLLAIAVRLYTAMYKKDEDIVMILDNVKDSLPKLRESIHTLH